MLADPVPPKKLANVLQGHKSFHRATALRVFYPNGAPPLKARHPRLVHSIMYPSRFSILEPLQQPQQHAVPTQLQQTPSAPSGGPVLYLSKATLLELLVSAAHKIRAMCCSCHELQSHHVFTVKHKHSVYSKSELTLPANPGLCKGKTSQLSILGEATHLSTQLHLGKHETMGVLAFPLAPWVTKQHLLHAAGMAPQLWVLNLR